MNSKAEFSTQNLLDCWTILYQNLSKTLLKRHGKDGEIVIRKANYKCGKSAGNLQKVQMQNSGHPVNLKELFQFCCSEKMDPRFRIQWQILDEEEAVFDVVTCPLYDLFSEQNDPVSLLPFCEEFHAGYINGYTEGIGQCCLSEHFSYSGENSCRFGCYFRASNTPAERRDACFTKDHQSKAAFPAEHHCCTSPQQYYSDLAALLVNAYVQECVSRYGDNASCFVAEGLKSAAIETVDFLKQRSFSAGKKLDETFIRENGFWYSESDLSAHCAQNSEIIITNYTHVLSKAAGL